MEMNKKILVVSLIAVLSGVANAQSFDSNNLGITFGANAFNDASGDKTTGYNFGLSYDIPINNKWLFQPELKYSTSGDAWGDKFWLGNFDLGYKFDLWNGHTLTPKLGYTYYDAIGFNTGSGYNAGVEFGVNKHISIETTYTHLDGGSGKFVNLTGLNLKYNF